MGIQKLLYYVLFLLSISIFIINLLFLLKGFYFSGDTISYLEFSEFAKPGGIRTVFLLHGSSWPPLTAMVFNTLHILPFSILIQQKIYTILILIFASISSYLLVGKFIKDNTLRLIASSFILFSGVQSLLLNAALCESLFLSLWLFSLYLFITFLFTKKDRYLILLILSVSLIPLTRYNGIPIALSFLIIPFLAIFRKSDRGYWIIKVAVAIFLSFIPIALYISNTKFKTGMFFGSLYPHTNETIIITIIKGVIQSIQDIAIAGIGAFSFGLIINWDKKFRVAFLVICTSLFSYLIALFVVENRYVVIEGLRSRFISPSYPSILLCLILSGSYLSNKLLYIKNLKLLFLTIFLAIIIYLYFQRGEVLFNNFRNSLLSPKEVGYSVVIENVCDTKEMQRYLFIQLYSRNWIGQSLYYYCRPIKKIYPEATTISFDNKSLIFTPYLISNPNLRLKEQINYLKTIYIYKTTTNTLLDPQKDITKLKLLD